LVFTFFNNALFKATSSEDGGIAQVEVEEDDWELAYQNAFEAGIEVPAISARCHAPNVFGTVDMEKVSQ